MPSDVESPIYATALHEEVFLDAASRDFDARASPPFDPVGAVFRPEVFRPSASGAEALEGDSTVLCEDTPLCAGPFWAASERSLLSGGCGPAPARPATSSATTPSATTATALPTNRRRL